MYRPGNGGIGNLFIQLTHVDVVSSSIYKPDRYKYIKIKNIDIREDDNTLETIDPPIYLGDPNLVKIRKSSFS
jgi:hypothetical protein